MDTLACINFRENFLHVELFLSKTLRLHFFQLQNSLTRPILDQNWPVKASFFSNFQKFRFFEQILAPWSLYGSLGTYAKRKAILWVTKQITFFFRFFRFFFLCFAQCINYISPTESLFPKYQFSHFLYDSKTSIKNEKSQKQS